MPTGSEVSQPEAQARLYLVSAPSGAGKTSLLQRLLAGRDDIVLSVSHTTRAPRRGEHDGEHYHFIDNAAFETMIAADAFVEHARVFDHYYGTARAPVAAALAGGSDVLLEIDWQGAQQVRKAWPKCRSVFILPPSRDALRERLGARGQDSEAVIERRMREAEEQASHYGEYDYLVFNDDFETALAELRAVFLADRLRCARQRYRHAALLRELTGEANPRHS